MNYIYNPSKMYFINISKILFVIVMLMSSSIIVAQSQKCNVDFEVAHNRNIKFAGESGADFIFVVTNKSNKVDTYLISVNDTKLQNKPKNNLNGFSNNNNVSLPVKIELGSKNIRNKTSKYIQKNNFSEQSIAVTLNPNEEKLVMVKIEVPKGTAIGRKNTTNVTLKSTNCKSVSITKQVYTETVLGE